MFFLSENWCNFVPYLIQKCINNIIINLISGEMRNKLLAAMALCCATSMSVWAGDWGTPAVKTVDPDLTIPEDPIPTTGFTYVAVGDYYIYHEATGMFLCVGNAYGTQLSVGNAGQLVRLQYGYDRLLYNADTYPYQGWLLTMPNAKSNSAEGGIFHEVFIGSASAAYADGTNGHMLWQILRQEDGTYRFKAIDEDAAYGSASEWADGFMARVPQSEEDATTVVQPMVIPGVAGSDLAEYDWSFVSVEGYEAYQAKSSIAKLLDVAETAGYTGNVDSYINVYQSAESTVEQIEEALDDLRRDLNAYIASIATPDNPVDMAFYIENAACMALDGWVTSGTVATQTNGQHWDDSSVYVEPCNWGATGFSSSMKQTLVVPNGMYKLTAAGRAASGGATTLTLFANDERVDFPALGDVGGTIATDGTEWESVEAGIAAGKTFANDNKGRGWTYQTINVIVEDGELTIGCESASAEIHQWCSISNFQLLYSGELSTDVVREQLKAEIAAAKQTAQTYVDNNNKWSTAGWEAYEADLKAAEEVAADPAAEEHELLAAQATLSARMTALAYDVNVYTTLMPAKLDELEDMWNRTETALELEALGEYVDELYNAYNAKTFDPADYDGITAKAEEIYAQCLREALLNGETDDASVFATNLNFSNGTTGWSGSPVVNYGVCEKYQTAFDVYQVVEGLPMGTYVVTVQGFYRPAGYADCATHYLEPNDTFNDICAYLYGNESQAPLMHIFADGVYEEKPNTADWGAALSAPNAPDIDGKYVANSMETANMAFEAGYYTKNEVTCAVAEDGKLRIGVRLVSSPNSSYWTIFDNFTITYKGESLDGFKISLESTLASAKEVAATTEVSALAQLAATIELAMDGYSTMEDYTTAIDKLNAAITTAQAIASANTVAESDDIKVDEDLNALKDLIATTSNNLAGYTTEGLTAATEELNAAVEKVNEGITLIKDIYQAASLFMTQNDEGAYNEYDQSAVNEFIDALDAVMMGYEEFGFETYAEVEEYRDEMYKAYTHMALSGSNLEGSAENPADLTDVLMSPSFENYAGEASSLGWNYVKDGGDANLVSSVKLFEMYNNNSFDMYQVVYGLPTGWYILEMQGFYRAGGSAAAMGARRDSTDARNAYLYATTSDGQTIKNALPSIFEGIVIGVGSTPGRDASDVVIDASYMIEGDEDYMYIPNTTAGANSRFELGLCKKELIFEVPAGCEYVRLGVKKDVMISTDWAIFDNFTLKYTGSDKPDAIESVEAAAAADVVSSAYYTIGGVRVAQPSVRGLYIRVDQLSDGSKKVTKIIVK